MFGVLKCSDTLKLDKGASAVNIPEEVGVFYSSNSENIAICNDQLVGQHRVRSKTSLVSEEIDSWKSVRILILTGEGM